MASQDAVASVDAADAAAAPAHALATTNRAARAMRWGGLYSIHVSFAGRSGACQRYCHVDLPACAFDPPAPSRRRCGPCDTPCKDCAACAVVTVIIRGECSLPTVLSRIQEQAAQLQALDLNGLKPPLGVVGATALKDVLPLLHGLLALALDNNGLQCAGMQVLSCELVKLTRLQAFSCANNSLAADAAACLAGVLSSLTGLQTLNLSGNQIADAGAACLAGVLSSLKRLTDFSIDVTPSAAVRCSAWLHQGLPVPPAEVVSSGWDAVRHYLSSADKVAVHKIRMLVIGDSEMGKTSLVRALMSRDDRAQVISAVDRTVGIDICRLVLAGTGPSVDALLYDLAGQDVYTLSHAMHFTGRCMYLLLWKPGASMQAALASTSRWLETLSVYVPDAIVVLVGSHCQSLPGDEYQQLAACVRERVVAKVAELNELTELEALKLHVLYKSAQDNVKAAVDAYKAASSASESLKRAEEVFEQRMRSEQLSPEEKAMSKWMLRAQARFGLPRSLRVLASCIDDRERQAAVLRDRLRVLLALRDGAEPHDTYPPAVMTLHTACVDSVAAVGIVELRQWLHEACMGLKFMGELLPQAWLDVSHALPSLGNGVLTMPQASAQVRAALQAASVNVACSDEEIARILRFWSRVGEIFV